MAEHRRRPRAAVREQMEGYILEHGLQPGDRLPAERKLCQQWGVSRTTLRSVMERMEADGLLYTRPGSGSYLAPAKFNRNLQDLHSFTWSAAQQGMAMTTRLLDLRRMECDKSLARHFGQVLGYPLYKIARLRRVNGVPLMLETAFIPAERVEGLERADLEHRSLFDVLEQTYGMIPTWGEEKVGITYAMADEAELLGVKEESPLFWIVSQTYDQTGELMEYCRTVARPDHLRLTSVLERLDAEEEEGEHGAG